MTGVEKAVIGPNQARESIPKMLDLMQGHVISQAIHAVVMLGVPDAIGAGKCSVDTIATRLKDNFPNVNTDSLGRSLSLLSSVGVFEESYLTAFDGGRIAQYSLTDCSKLLQTGVPNQPSLASGAIHWMEPCLWGAWGKLFDYMSGALPADCEPFKAYNKSSIFEYYANNPTSAKHFNNFMTQFSTLEIGLVTDMFGWGPFAKAGAKVVDIGGSKGTVLAALKKKYPSLNCINFDLEEVIEHAKAEDANSGVEFVAGDMFKAATFPAHPDVFLMKHILHDWSDDDSGKVLRAMHEASGANVKLIMGEGVLPEPGDPVTPLSTATKKVDVLMNLIKGRERSRKDWENLLNKNGWKLEDIIVTPAPVCQLLVCAKAD
eukprot:Nk52_evm9s254 gene=Nk52_evmTU9s254